MQLLIFIKYYYIFISDICIINYTFHYSLHVSENRITSNFFIIPASTKMVSTIMDNDKEEKRSNYIILS